MALYLKEHRDLVLESYKVCKVLDIIVESNMKSRDTNDVQAIKCHYFATIIRLANKSMKNSEDTLDAFVKRWVICQKVGHLSKGGSFVKGVSFVKRQVICQKMGLSP